MNCNNITKLVTQQKHYIYFVVGQNKIKTLQFHKPSQTQKQFHMQTSKNGGKKDHAIRYQIKILTCSQAKKYFFKKDAILLSNRKQTCNIVHKKNNIKIIQKKNFTKRKEKEFTYISLGVCALCFLSLIVPPLEKKITRLQLFLSPLVG